VEDFAEEPVSFRAAPGVAGSLPALLTHTSAGHTPPESAWTNRVGTISPDPFGSGLV